MWETITILLLLALACGYLIVSCRRKAKALRRGGGCGCGCGDSCPALGSHGQSAAPPCGANHEQGLPKKGLHCPNQTGPAPAP